MSKFCTKCGKETEDGSTICSECAAKESVNTYVPEPEKKSKKGLIIGIVAAICALALVVTGVFVVPKVFAIPGSPKHLFSAIDKSLNRNNVTIEMDDEKFYVDLADLRYLYSYSYDDEDGGLTTRTNAAARGEIYNLTEDEKGLPRGYIDNYDQDDVSDIKEIILTVMGDLAKGKATELEKLDNYELLEEMLKEEMGLNITDKELQGLLDTAVKLLNDKKWLKEEAGFEHEKDGKGHEYTFSFVLYDMIDELLEQFEDDLPTDLRNAIRNMLDESKDTKKEWASMIVFSEEVEITVTVEDGLLDSVKIALKADGFEDLTLEIEFSDWGETEFSTNDVEKKLKESHGSSETCQLCGDEELYFHGACFSCARDYYCNNYCGEKKYDSSNYCYNCGK